MNLLDRIKTYGTVCCVCGSKMSTDLNLLSEFGNTHYFSLSSNSYPLEFKRFVPFNNQVESLYVDQNDDIKFPWRISQIRIQSKCGYGHYTMVYFNINEPWGSQRKIDFAHVSPGCVIENIIIEEFMIRSIYNITYIYKNNGSGDVRASHSHLLTMPLKDSTYWPLSNVDKLREKINSLLLLK